MGIQQSILSLKSPYQDQNLVNLKIPVQKGFTVLLLPRTSETSIQIQVAKYSEEQNHF